MNAQTFRCYRLNGWPSLSSFLLFFCMLSGVIWIDYQNTLELMHQRTESTLQEMLKRLQMRLEDAIVKDGQDRIEQEFGLIEIQPGSNTIALINDQDVIVASNHPDWMHRPIPEMFPSFDLDRLARMRQTSHIDLQYDPQSRRFTAFVPVQFQGGEHAMGSPDIGAVYYVYDHAFIEKAMLRQLANHCAFVWSAILVAFVLSRLIWDFLAGLRIGTDLKKYDPEGTHAGMNPLVEQMSDWSDTIATQESEQNNQMLGAMLNQSITEILVIDCQSLHFRHVNQGGVSNLGYQLDELVKMTLFDVYPEYDEKTFAHLIAPLVLGKQSQLQFESIHRRKDGTCYPVEVWLQMNHNGPAVLIAIALDISQRKEHEEKIKRLNNFNAILSKINQSIVQIQNETELFAQVCEISIELDHVRMAWIGKLNGATEMIAPVAAAGDRLDYLSSLIIPVKPDIPEGLGPTGQAYRDSRIVAVNDFQHDPMTAPWHDTVERYYGWQASCAVPITLNHQPYAVLSVYADQLDFFEKEVLDLLTELSLNLSFALGMYEREVVRRATEQKMELWAKVFSQNREAVIIADKENRIVSVNQAFTRITGYEEHEVLGKNSRLLSSGLHGKVFYRSVWKTLSENDFWQGELVERKKDGSIYTEWLTISVVRDEAGNVVNYIAIFTDITQLKAAKQQIEHMAHYDALTNLPNRLLLKARVDHEISTADRNRQTFALLFIDLDHFKNINDALGHSVGDQVLIEVGKRLLSTVREEDTVARVGGDEFNIQLSNTDWHGAATVAKKIIAALDAPINYQQYQLYVQPSIGISLYPENGNNYEMLTRNADTALYKAKEHGRNQYQFFTQAMQQQTQRRMEIENRLRNALERNELRVYYQAQIDAESQRISGAEALLRWHHPELGWVSPDEFIPVAEECGLILSIGDWVLEQAIMQARCWHEAGYPVSVAVNLSLAQFRANTLHEAVKYYLERHQLPPRFLELELTESIAIQNVEAAIEITRQLSALGVEISIDDFGTGYSSLSYLQRFSIDKLKIDQSFTRGMTNNKESENIVDAIISLAKSLKMKTIAEGVETEQQLAMYKQKECDQIQGFYFSRPVPAEEFTELLKRF